jgi:hypothetical protein
LFKKSNGSIALNIYDKLKEMKKTSRELYEYAKNGCLNGKKVLRCELQILQRVNRALGIKSVRVAHLKSPSFVRRLSDIWLKRFSELTAKKQFVFSSELSNFEMIKKELIALGIYTYGYATLMSHLDSWTKEGKLTTNQKSYSKRKINDYVKCSGSLVELDYRKELIAEMGFLHKELSNDDYNAMQELILNSKTRKQNQINPEVNALRPILIPELED